MTRAAAFAWLSREASPWQIVRAVGWIALAFLFAAGFGFRTPQQTFARQDTLIAHNATAIAAVSTRQDRTEDKFIVLFKLSCLNRQYSRRDFQLVGLKCDSLLNGPVVMQAGANR